MTETKKTIEIIMDKISAQSITLIILAIGVLTAFIISLVLFGFDTAVLVFSALSPFVTVILVYFGLAARGSEAINERLTDLLTQNEKTVKYLVDKLADYETRIRQRLAEAMKESTT